jgi:peptidoglycan/LPS O-acetylase OafA/YrhL
MEPPDHAAPHQYRPDIDGLRAVAVISVVIFHAFPALAPGGYVGVDVFFVISGFLITSLILDNLNKGSFSALDFYARRIRRILPALILLLVGCLALGWLNMLPDEFRLLGSHVFASAGFWTNIALWKEAGYFDPEGIQKPLLHLWSLAIEEQFYVVWPCLVLLAFKLGRRVLLATIAVIALLSFCLNLAAVGYRSAATFYLLPTRAWELLAGACLIWIGPFLQAATSRSPFLKRFMTELPSIIGLSLLIASFAFLNSKAAFPGWRAVPPVLGTMLLLCMGPGTMINRVLLSHPVPVAIGLISYPLYMWHWPALAFPHIVGIDSVSSRVISVLVAAGLAAATYLFVERRARRGSPSLSLALLGILAVVGGIGLLAKQGVLQPRSSTPELKEISAAVDDYMYPSDVSQPLLFEDQTFWKEGSGPESIVFWGDSNAEMYFPRAQKVARETGKSFVVAVGGGCPPIFGAVERCETLVQSGFKFAATSPAKTVVMGAQWFTYITNANEDERARMYAAIRSEIADLRARGKRVFIVLNTPIGVPFGPKARATRHLYGLEFHAPTSLPETSNDVYRPVSENLKKIAVETGSVAIDPFQTLCRNGLCLTSDDLGRPAYKDGVHLRADFARERATYIDQVFE